MRPSLQPSCSIPRNTISFPDSAYSYTVNYVTGYFRQTWRGGGGATIGYFAGFDENVAKFENGDECGSQEGSRRGTVTYLHEECSTNTPILVSFTESPVCAYHAVIKGLCCSANWCSGDTNCANTCIDIQKYSSFWRMPDEVENLMLDSRIRMNCFVYREVEVILCKVSELSLRVF